MSRPLLSFLALFLAVATLVPACSGPSSSSELFDPDGGLNDGGSGLANVGGGEAGLGDGGGRYADGCVPQSCESVAANCGKIPDGCGTRSCGTCAAGETCGGAGTANVCGVGICIPKSCALVHKNCGMVSDGCGDTLDCGECGAGLHCGGGGSNVCGAAVCEPKTCPQLGKDCGIVSDGCAGTLSCGACQGGKQCGAGTTANVCAAPCPLGCPSGYMCGGGGVCRGGTPAALTLDVKTEAVGGNVTLNGVAPNTTALCTNGAANTKAQVFFTETTQGYSFVFNILCGSGTNDYTFAGVVFPGTYSVAVKGASSAYSNLPTTAYVAVPRIAIN